MKKRVTYFDLAKGIGIILVVLGHMENINTGLRVWISSFHMPLFFVISGMLMACKGEADLFAESNDFSALAKKKAKGILMPYFWFSLIYIPIDIMNLYIHNVDMHTFIQNILDSITLSGVSVMWFLPALFIAEVTAIYIINLVKKYKKTDKLITNYVLVYVCALILTIVAFLVWSMIRPYYEANSGSYVVATALGFVRMILRGLAMGIHVVTGFIMYKVITATEAKFKNYTLPAGVILFVLNIGLCMKNGAVDNHFLTLNFLPLYFLCAFLGSMAIILISKGLGGSIPFIEFFGKNSLVIMATHLQCYLLYAGIRIALLIDMYVTRAKSYVYMFNSVLFTMLIEVVVILIINRFFPFVLGRKRNV